MVLVFDIETVGRDACLTCLANLSTVQQFLELRCVGSAVQRGGRRRFARGSNLGTAAKLCARCSKKLLKLIDGAGCCCLG